MRTRLLPLAGLLAGVLTVTACGSSADDTTAGGAGDSAGSTATQAAFNEQDEQFAAGMRAHHAQAVEMADMVLTSGPTPEVADLAERIKAAQTPEIEELDVILADMGVEPGHSGGHGSAHGADMPVHEGMMTDEQMRQLEEADGTEAERLFLQLMTEHHEGALTSAERQLAEGEHPRLREIAQAILDSQSAEIAEMQQLLTQL
jgi:uncharacterized protein (DUF305 family)